MASTTRSRPKARKTAKHALPGGPVPLSPVPQAAVPARMLPLFEELTANLTRWNLGILPIRLANPDELVGRKGLKIFSQMRLDDQVHAALKLKKHAALSTGWDVRTPQVAGGDPRVQAAVEFVKWNFHEGMPGTLDDDLLEVLTASEFGFCLGGDTAVHTLDGDRPIKDLVGRQPWVFSWEGDSLRLAKARRVWRSKRNALCVKVVYEWWAHGKRQEASIICTDSHPFRMLGGNYVRAKGLKPGDRLTPFAQKIGHPGYGKPRAYVKASGLAYGKGAWQKRSHWVWEQANGPLPAESHIHHSDDDPMNDAPDNLVAMPKRGREVSHASYHIRQWFRKASSEQIASRSRALTVANTPEMRARKSVATTQANLRNWKDPEIRRKRIVGISGQKRTPEQLVRIRAAARDPERREKLRQAALLREARKRETARNHQVVSVEPWGVADVYDMEVPGYHNFAANRVFVHNSVTELVWNAQSDGDWRGKIVLKKLATRKPDNFVFLVDQHDNLLPNGVEQFGKPYPTDRFILYTPNKEFDCWYGQSDLRPAYRFWWLKDNILKWMAMFMDRYSVPLAVGKHPRNPDLQGTSIAGLRDILSNLQAATSITIPNDIELEFPAVASAQGAAIFERGVQMADMAIARSLLLPNLLGVSAQGDVGSYSQARKQFDVFILVIEKLQRDLAEIVMGEIIKRLCDLNWAGLPAYPEFFFLPFTETDKTQLLGMFNQAIAAGVVQPRPVDEVHVRATTEFPEVSLEEIERSAKEAKAQGQAGMGPFGGGPGGEGPGGPPAGVGAPGGTSPGGEMSDEDLNKLIDEALGGKGGGSAGGGTEDALTDKVAEALKAKGVRIFAFDEAEHPRQPEGSSEGGQFTPAGGVKLDARGLKASEINKELDKLDAEGSKLNGEMIAAGRGSERPSEYLKKTDPLSLRLRANFDRSSALRNEIDARYGPGAPHRLPSGRRFGPRKFAAGQIPRADISDALAALRADQPDATDDELVQAALEQLTQGGGGDGQDAGGRGGDASTQGQDLTDEELDVLIDEALAGSSPAGPEISDEELQTLEAKVAEMLGPRGATPAREDPAWQAVRDHPGWGGVLQDIADAHPDWNGAELRAELERQLGTPKGGA